MSLLIVESPGKIKKLRSFLGSGWEVLASVGHVCDLPRKNFGINFAKDKVSLTFVVNPDKESAVEKLKKAANRVDTIFLATDPDREGEAIAYHVGMMLGKSNWSKIKRISFNEITSAAVKSALGKPRRVNADLVHAQQARRVVDRVVGYKVSPLLWKQKNSGTSAGRVQSVAVRMVAEREQQIREFKPQEYWNLEAFLAENQDSKDSFQSELVKYKGKKIVSRLEEGKESKQHIIKSAEEAQQIAEQVKPGPWIVKKKERKLQKRKPMPPLVTSSLQQAAHGVLKWNADKTMKVAQSLYEKGLITYMRTDAPVISDDALKQVRSYIKSTYGEPYLPGRPFIYKAKDKRSQEAHECIRPTKVQVAPGSTSGVSGEANSLYKLIWERFVACQMSAAEYDTGTIHIGAPQSEFLMKGKRLTFDGWTKVVKTRHGSKELVGDNTPLLPPFVKGQELSCKEIKNIQSFTKPPPRYTEARLIKTLEARSIGRPSTYAAILKNIKKRGYVHEDKRVFYATEVGERLVGFLLERFEQSFMDIEFTAKMEDQLDQIALGDRSWEQVVREFYSDIMSRLGKDGQPRLNLTLEEQCHECGKDLVLRNGQRGPFVGCSGYPACRVTRNPHKNELNLIDQT